MLFCNVIAGAFATIGLFIFHIVLRQKYFIEPKQYIVCFAFAFHDLRGLSANEAAFLIVNAMLVLPISSTLITFGPGMITAPEVSLYTLMETVLGPVWVWLGGFETPTLYSIFGGSALLITLAIHR